MSYSDLETTENGNLVNYTDWTEDIAREIAAGDGIAELTEKHFDLLKYLRDQFENHNGNQPNERHMVKAMSELWGEKISTKELYDLFPKQPSKQATCIAGLPETRRKGGY
ncbi:MAG: TusE/DsrC/DsvC family sulfur relay protein [Rhodospirillales bacterium]|nr:TusE/DsrC/DsvC family sulfur relay protein [Rhodospirillales bacterium]